jgi:soluble lytic murein transglycosylase-like protein
MRMILSILLTVGTLTRAADCATPELVAWAAYYAEEFGLDPDLFTALIWVESRFCQEALSPKGAVGVGQLMPATATELGVDPYNLHQNFWGAAQYLRTNFEAFGDWTLALAAYNAGPGRVQRYDGVPPFAETQTYVVEVLSVYRTLAERRRATDP